MGPLRQLELVVAQSVSKTTHVAVPATHPYVALLVRAAALRVMIDVAVAVKLTVAVVQVALAAVESTVAAEKLEEVPVFVQLQLVGAAVALMDDSAQDVAAA